MSRVSLIIATMKRAHVEKPGEKTHKKKKISVQPLRGDSLKEAIAACCLRSGEPLSNQPLVVRALDSGCWLSASVAYWPADEKIGQRVYDALLEEDNMHHDTDMDPTIHLIRAFMAFDTEKKRLCKLLGVSKLRHLGVLRHVGTRTGGKTVDAALLDVREFRLDLQY